jgi:hypothetical protein
MNAKNALVKVALGIQALFVAAWLAAIDLLVDAAGLVSDAAVFFATLFGIG